MSPECNNEHKIEHNVKNTSQWNTGKSILGYL